MSRMAVLAVTLLSSIGAVSALSPPTNLATSGVAQHQVILTWTDNSTDDTGFKIERQIGTGPWSQVATTWGGPWIDSNLAPSTTYSYRVRTYNESGDSAYSSPASATTLAAVPCGNPPNPVSFNPIPTLRVHVDFPVDFWATLTDPNPWVCGLGGHYEKVSGPAEFDLDGAGGLFYWKPAAAGDFTIQLKFVRGDGFVATTSFTAHVDDNTMTYPLFRDYLSQALSVPVIGRTHQPMQSYSIYAAPRTAPGSPTRVIGPVTTPVPVTGSLGNWNIGGLQDGSREIITLVVQAPSGENSYVNDEVIIDRSAKAGWPIRTDPLTHSVVLTDLDQDGSSSEVIAVTHFGRIKVWNIDGSPRWSATVGGGTFSGPSIGDIDGDQKLDIVTGIYNKLVAYHSNGQPVAGFPIQPGDGREFRAIPTLVDLTGDGVLDIVAPAQPYSGQAAVRAYTYVGTAPQLLWVRYTNHPSLYASASAADLDGDGKPEVIVESYDRVYAWHSNGDPVSGLNGAVLPVPVTGAYVAGGGGYYSSAQPAIADLDADGIKEIIVAGNVLEEDGTVKHGWEGGRPGEGQSLSAAVANFDSNPLNGLEVVLGRRAWHADGTALPAIPGSYSSASLGDAGEQNAELYRLMGTRLVGINNYGIDAFEPNGTRVAGYPKSLFGETGDVSVPQIGDFDNDGKIDVAVAVTDASYGGIIAIYNVGGALDPNNLPWPMLGHDVLHTGYTSLCPWFYCGK